MMDASLGMYDGGELGGANDALWSGIARRLRTAGLRDIPERLNRSTPLDDLWASGRLIFGQTCGYPLVTRYRDLLTVLATPTYSAPGCTDSHHRSFLVVPLASPARSLHDLRGARAAVNDVSSMTGYRLLVEVTSLGEVVPTGSHAKSLERVAGGECDVAAIDCVTYAHLARTTPGLAATTRILAETRATPSLPFVVSTRLGAGVTKIVFDALAQALADPALSTARERLLLTGIRRLDATAYASSVAYT